MCPRPVSAETSCHLPSPSASLGTVISGMWSRTTTGNLCFIKPTSYKTCFSVPRSKACLHLYGYCKFKGWFLLLVLSLTEERVEQGCCFIYSHEGTTSTRMLNILVVQVPGVLLLYVSNRIVTGKKVLIRKTEVFLLKTSCYDFHTKFTAA